ncbi:MAG: helix-turn-helix domain-containing protein [Oscillospiraceae bacterium]|nr:helix-turn-helix domain-containing protein [Oscillospiraceae bacterium]
MSKLKELRKEKGYSQIQVQMKIGIDQSEYSKMERGVRNLSYENCRLLAVLFGTSMDYLAGLTDVKEPYPRADNIIEI